MDLLADEFDLSPPALGLLAAYRDAERDAAPAQSPGSDEAAGPSAGDEDEPGEEDDAPPLRVVGVPRLPADDEAGTTSAADLHGVLLAAGALDLDLSDLAGGVRYTVTRAGRGLLAKAA